ncbi:universal stress protein [Haloarcula sp. S1CR25-12]|uniref:Universal stress protein n=1 Tax=Haloarcula saliterrae TaxID=2950534 RepID=A0ABU2FBF3_9EURY|nr:amino acid permease [Haloarcula sp. S1CR25-12]MDS0259602.1 universal stress protein [Haloarcula sp. S1CR25-12]
MVEHTRTLDFKIAFAIGLGTMIAAGIFSLSGTAVAAVGSSAVIAFVIAALVASVTAGAYSEFASIYSENGGGYLFCSQTFEDRDLLTYAIGMSLFLGYTGTTAFYLATMDEWFFRFIVPESLQFLPHGTTGVLAALLLGVLNARGTEESGGFQLVVTGAKVAVLLAFVAGAFSFRGPSSAVGTFAGGFVVAPVDIVTISALAFITFFGFSAIAASAGEIIDPQRTVPRAIAASIVTVTVLYTLVIVAMVNSPVPAEIIAQEGETAMGRVAEGFLGSIGESLIVAGAVFSMVSASNASILAASSIGSLMGQRGQAPRRFARIHREYGTPFWSVTTATATIVSLIVAFIAVFPSEGGLFGLDLGLTALTGFATLNLLLPLAVVNVALVFSRRRYPDIERGFSVPGVPLVPVVGVLANLGLVYNLPQSGVVTGVVLTAALVGAYLLWGGRPATTDMFREIVPRSTPAEASEGTPAEAEAAERFRVLVPVARPDRALRYVRLAAALARASEAEPVVNVLNVTHVPDQTPWETVQDTARARTERLQAELEHADVGVDYTVEGHTCRDIAFDIVRTAREDDADLLLLGYPERHRDVTETVEREAPCDLFFADRTVAADDLSTINIGAGGGPHHEALLPLVDELGKLGSELHLINVSSTEQGTDETPGTTLDALAGAERTAVTNVFAESVAEGLVETAADNGGVLVVGASRDRWLKQALFGSTPDEVVRLSAERDVPVLVYASETGVRGQLSERLFPLLRYLRKRLPRRGSPSGGTPSDPSDYR